MSGTIWADVLDKMHDLVVAETFIAAEIAAGRLKVFDGPPVNQFNGNTIFTIGGMPTLDDGEPEVTSSWDVSSLGVDGAHADIDDMFSVPCGIQTRLGEANVRKARRTAITVYAAAAAFYRGTTLNLPAVMWCMPQMAGLRQSYTQDGAEVLITFFVHVRTRI